MANVLKYLTGALSKRAKRKGNLAVGIGEENYGPSSTTGYYAGVTPPENGFVVYATGSNSNPKVFVAETEDDLPAIARTLGGGILDVLGAKNYIAGLTHAWVINSVPNNTITDGLVLDLNAKNPSSFIDNEPTDNLFGTTAMEFKDDAGIYTNNIISGTDSIGKYFIKDVNNAPWWSGLRIYNNNIRPLTAGVSYVLSFECRSGQTGWSWAYDSNASGGGWSGNDQGRLSNTNLVFDKTGGTVYTSDMANTWQRVSYRVTMKDSSVFTGADAYPHDSFFTNTNNVQIYYRNAQLEVGREEATDYSSGARSQNTTWYDLSGNGDAVAVNSPVFSNGSFTFDQTNEYFSLTNNGLNNISGSVTLMGVCKQGSTGSPHQTVLCTDINYRNGLKLMSRYHGAAAAWIGNSDGTNSYLLSSGVDITNDGKWHHLTTTRDNSTGTLKIYVDGILKNSVNTYSGATSRANIAAIGVDYHSSGYYYIGNISSVKAYDRVLNDLEIQQNYYGSPITTQDLIFTIDAGNLVSYESGSLKSYSLLSSTSGSLENGVAYHPEFGGYFSFDGSNDRILMEQNSSPSSTYGIPLYQGDKPWMVNAWVRTTTAGSNSISVAPILSNRSGGPVYCNMGIGDGGVMKYNHYDGAWQTSVGNIPVNDGEWHMLSWVNKDNDTMDLYVDGVFDINVNSEIVGGPSNPVDIIGGSWASYFDGDIAFLAIYRGNTLFTSDEVAQNYNAQKARFGK